MKILSKSWPQEVPQVLRHRGRELLPRDLAQVRAEGLVALLDGEIAVAVDVRQVEKAHPRLEMRRKSSIPSGKRPKIVDF